MSEHKSTPGQGLLETIVAIGVITTGLLSVITLVISNLTTQREAALRYQAMNLAREGIELVRNQRDSRWLQGESPWSEFSEGEMAPQFSFESPTVTFTPATAATALVNKCADGTYAQNPALCTMPTPFSRVLTFDLLDCGAQTLPCAAFSSEEQSRVALQVTSEVRWQDQGRARVVKLSSTLYDWR